MKLYIPLIALLPLMAQETLLSPVTIPATDSTHVGELTICDTNVNCAGAIFDVTSAAFRLKDASANTRILGSAGGVGGATFSTFDSSGFAVNTLNGTGITSTSLASGSTASVCATTAGLLTISGCPGGASSPFIDSTAIMYNAADPTKLLKLSAVNVPSGGTRTITAQGFNYTLAGIDIGQNFTGIQTFSADIREGGVGANIGQAGGNWFNDTRTTALFTTNLQIAASSTIGALTYVMGQDVSNNFILKTITGTIMQAVNTGTPDISLFGRVTFPGLAGGGTVLTCVDNTGLLKISGCPGSAGSPFIDSTAIVYNASDATKLLKLSAASITTATTRTLTAQDDSYIIAGTNLSQTFGNTQTFSSNLTLGGSATLTTPSGSNGVAVTLACSGAQAVTGLTLSAGIATAASCGTVSGFASTWTSYTPSTTHLSSTSVQGSYNTYGKTYFFHIWVQGTSDGTVPTFGLPNSSTFNSSYNYQTLSCTIDGGGGQIAGAPLGTGGAGTFQIRTYNNTAYANTTVYQFVCNGVYEAT